MPDNLADKGPLDGKLISLKEDHEIDFWTATLGVTRDELRRAVESVGHSAAAVRDYFDVGKLD